MLVKITQFIRPNGRQVETSCQVDARLGKKYLEILAAKCRLTAEMVPGNFVSQCIEHDEGDFDIMLSQNGPGVKADLERMIARFDIKKFEKWLKEIKGEEAPKIEKKPLKERK